MLQPSVELIRSQYYPTTKPMIDRLHAPRKRGCPRLITNPQQLLPPNQNGDQPWKSKRQLASNKLAPLRCQYYPTTIQWSIDFTHLANEGVLYWSLLQIQIPGNNLFPINQYCYEVNTTLWKLALIKIRTLVSSQHYHCATWLNDQLAPRTEFTEYHWYTAG